MLSNLSTTTPLQAYNLINDLLQTKDPSTYDPNLPYILKDISCFGLPLIQHEISIKPTHSRFDAAFTTGMIVGEKYSDIRVLRQRANDSLPNLIPIVKINCSTPILKEEPNYLNQPNEHDIFLVTSDTSTASQRPLVVLLPWGGSLRRQYWPIVYEYVVCLHYDVLLFNMKMVETSQIRGDKAIELYTRLNEFQNTSYVTHCFSMNGAWTNARIHLIDELRNGTVRKRGLKLINDSCPSAIDTSKDISNTTEIFQPKKHPYGNASIISSRISVLMGTSRAYMSGIAQGTKVVYSDSRLAGIFTSGVLTAIAQECIQGKQNVLDMYDNSLTNIMLQQTCTQLFMYSDGDMLINYKSVENAINIIKENCHGAVHVVQHKFSGSPHCMHYRRNPIEYMLILKNFLNDSSISKI